ncbi:Alpha-latrocrustotoxin-Lt1a [Bienertia sinuspersici]
MEDEAREQRMTKELFEIVAEGSDPSLIWVYSDESVIRKTSVGNNIMHIALKNPNNSIVEQVRIRCPHLTGEKNMYGDTPIHIAAQMGNEGFVRQVCDRGYNLTLLRMQNSIGHTPLHVALIHNNFNVAKILIDKDPELASIVNNSNEAPLHLVLQYFPDGDHLGTFTFPCLKYLPHPLLCPGY